MKTLEKLLLQALLWILPAPHRAGQLVSDAGDLAAGEIARLYFKTMRALGDLEESEVG